eukprot:16451049-Heterocapsa_arctica.AAC.3
MFAHRVLDQFHRQTREGVEPERGGDIVQHDALEPRDGHPVLARVGCEELRTSRSRTSPPWPLPLEWLRIL